MSKSRNSDAKGGEKKDKEAEVEGEKDKRGGEKDNATDEEEEDNARARNVQIPMNQLQLTAETESNLQLAFDSNSLMVKDEHPIPRSPPPTYEHVIEETRLEHAAGSQKYDAGNNPENASGKDNRTKAPKKILHKSSKELYRAVAKQWGITCKMSDHCRCLDCQSCYFDCEYDKNENEKTDGGLGAGTPMFLSEVMQDSGCVVL
ncbi:unnamed protein product [Xylocopa violacea]|uniref:DUF4802 domain-containing protein n=1 Tax=Xylocopa violacea TaxID=135666 RepID=A0ABP1N4P4_XYLVO